MSSPNSEWFKGGMPEVEFDSAAKSSAESALKSKYPEVKKE